MNKDGFNGTKDIAAYCSQGMASQSILANLMHGTEVVSKLCSCGLDVKVCMNSKLSFKMIADIGTEFSNSYSMSMAMTEYDQSDDVDRVKLEPYLESARTILHYWRISVVAKINSEKPMLVKDLFIPPLNTCFDDDLELYEYGAKYVFDLLADIVSKIDYAYPNLDDRARPVIAEEISRYLNSIVINAKKLPIKN